VYKDEKEGNYNAGDTHGDSKHRVIHFVRAKSDMQIDTGAKDLERLN
jgi:hypothetical protein